SPPLLGSSRMQYPCRHRKRVREWKLPTRMSLFTDVVGYRMLTLWMPIALPWQMIGSGSLGGGQGVTAGFLRRSQFHAFFGYLVEANGNNQTRPFTNNSAPTDAAEIVDGEMTDQAMDDGTLSPRLSPGLHTGSPPDWSTFLSDIGLASLDMVPSNLEVNVIIPRHEPKRISLPNDAASINAFLDGLKLRRFSFYADNNRPIFEDDVYMWHRRNPLEILHARLTEESVREYTTSE
ncbi:hypothetical protein KXV92_008694, partial [Aspergillus fumigatus]